MGILETPCIYLKDKNVVNKFPENQARSYSNQVMMYKTTACHIAESV